jgi:hypothetical protein
MSVVRHPATSIATYQVWAAAHAVLHHAEEMADAQVQDESVERDEEAVVVVEERISLETADQRKHKRSWMLRWRIIGVEKRMGLALTHLLNLLPL